MFRKLFAVTVAILTAAGAVTAAQAKDRLVVIGTQELDSGATSATIDVSKARGAFKAIRLRAKKGPIEFTGLRFVYSDDTFQTVDKQFTLQAREQTRALDERDAARFVDTVVVNYKSSESKQPMEVEIYGLQSRDGARKQRPKSPAKVAAQPPTSVPAGATKTVQPAPQPPKPAPVLADPASITEGRDVMFGYQNVGSAGEREKIRVGLDVGKFHAIRLRVLESDIHVTELEVFYADGTSQVLAINQDIKANQKSKWYRVNDKVFIKEIQLAYRSNPKSKGQARVEVVGQYADGWLAAQGEGRKFNDGWVLLGSQTAGAIGFDKDVVSVGKNEGGFKQVRLKVRDRSITLREIRVVYFSGPDEVIKTNDRVDPDQIAGPWELKPGRPAIKEIVAVYRRRLVFGKGQGQAVAEFWGLH